MSDKKIKISGLYGMFRTTDRCGDRGVVVPVVPFTIGNFTLADIPGISQHYR